MGVFKELNVLSHGNDIRLQWSTSLCRIVFMHVQPETGQKNAANFF